MCIEEGGVEECVFEPGESISLAIENLVDKLKTIFDGSGGFKELSLISSHQKDGTVALRLQVGF